jgi:HNH endonuclease
MTISEVRALPNPASLDATRRRSKRRWGGKLKDYKCFCCGSATHLSNHHIEPRDAGGSDSEKNKVTLCNACHNVLEGEPWSAIVDRKEKIQSERYAVRNGRPRIEAVENWIGRTPREKVASIRQHCLNLGVLHNSSGRHEDFRQAFRTMNAILDEMTLLPNDVRVIRDPNASLASILAVRDLLINPLRAEADRLLHAGTQAQWVAALLAYANS